MINPFVFYVIAMYKEVLIIGQGCVSRKVCGKGARVFWRILLDFRSKGWPQSLLFGLQCLLFCAYAFYFF
jgi:hypothetical protein